MRLNPEMSDAEATLLIEQGWLDADATPTEDLPDIEDLLDALDVELGTDDEFALIVAELERDALA